MNSVPIKYAIKNITTQQYYTVNQEVVAAVTDIVYLRNSPMTWEGEQLKWVRNNNYIGIFRSQNENGHRFATDGAKILRHIFSIEGTLARYDLELHWLNTSTQQYSLLCSSGLDFASYKNTRDYVEIALKEGGLIAKIKAFENTDFEIPITDNDSVPVFMGGIKMETVYSYITIPFASNVFVPFPANTDHYSIIMALGSFETSGSYLTGEAQSALSLDNSSKDQNVILKLYRDSELVIDYDLNFYYEALSGNIHPHRLALYATVYSDNTYTSYVNYKLWVDPGAALTHGQNRLLKAKGSNTLLCAADDRVLISVGVDTADPGLGSSNTDQIKWNVEKDNNFSLKTISYTPSGVVRGYRTGQLFNKFADKLTGGQFQVKSSFLSNTALSLVDNYDTFPYRNIYTSGDALKSLGTPSEPAKIQTKFSDLYQNIRSVYNVGLGIENEKLVIEPLEYFYQKDVLIYDLGENIDVQSFEFTPVKDLFASTLEAGYANESQNDINGKDEFNVKQTYTSPYDNSTNKINWVSPYTTGMMGIEIARLNTSNKITPDSGNDNNCYILAVTDQIDSNTGAYKLEQYGNNINGVTHPDTVYNVPFSPNRSIMRHKYHLTSMFSDIRTNNKKLFFQTSDANTKFTSSMYAPIPLGVAADIDLNGITNHLFKPYTFSFDAVSPDNLVAMMNANSYGVFGFRYRGVYYEGFVMEVGINPAKKAKYRFVLLASPKADLSDLF